MKNFKKNLKILEKNHIYSKSMEHDACGVGLVASIEGKKSRKVVEYAINALKAVWHRGAVDADGKTGDGAGIHVEIPHDFFVKKTKDLKFMIPDEGQYGVGVFFMPQDSNLVKKIYVTILFF